MKNGRCLAILERRQLFRWLLRRYELVSTRTQYLCEKSRGGREEEEVKAHLFRRRDARPWLDALRGSGCLSVRSAHLAETPKQRAVDTGGSCAEEREPSRGASSPSPRAAHLAGSSWMLARSARLRTTGGCARRPARDARNRASLEKLSLWARIERSPVPKRAATTGRDERRVDLRYARSRGTCLQRGRRVRQQGKRTASEERERSTHVRVSSAGSWTPAAAFLRTMQLETAPFPSTQRSRRTEHSQSAGPKRTKTSRRGTRSRRACLRSSAAGRSLALVCSSSPVEPVVAARRCSQEGVRLSSAAEHGRA